jgi:hypothetical protein
VVEVRSRDATSTRGLTRAICWLLAASFFVATVLIFLLEYDITASPPADPPGNDFVAGSVAFFQNEQDRWPQELTANLLFGLGFLLLVPVGLILRRAFGREDLRSTIGSSAFAVAGVIGLAAQLIYVGAKEVAIDPRYCQCEYAPEQIISQNRALAMAEGSQRWLLIGFLLALAVGFYLMGRLALDRGVLGRGWGYLSLAGAAVSLVGFVAALLQADPVFELFLAAGGGVVLPIWAVVLGRRLGATPDATATADRVR